VVVESGFGSMWVALATGTVRVKIVNPDSVVAANVPRPTESRLPDVDSWVALDFSVGVFFFVVVIVGLPM